MVYLINPTAYLIICFNPICTKIFDFDSLQSFESQLRNCRIFANYVGFNYLVDSDPELNKVLIEAV